MTNKTVHINSIFWYILLFVFFLFLVLSIQNKTVLIMFDIHAQKCFVLTILTFLCRKMYDNDFTIRPNKNTLLRRKT